METIKEMKEVALALKVMGEECEVRDRIAQSALAEFIRSEPAAIGRMTQPEIDQAARKFYAMADAMMVARRGLMGRTFTTNAELDAVVKGD